VRRLALVVVAAAIAAGNAGATDYIASTGEAVDVVVAPGQEQRGQEIAELVASFPHGPELADVTISLLDRPHAQVQCLGAVACYSPFYETITIPDATDEYPWEQVLAHEYGHHVASNRLNAPWEATFWGPKHWASAAGVCPANRREPVFASYETHPAEAFAEAYRLFVATRMPAWAPFQTFIDAVTFPMGPEILAAVERDVMTPWLQPRSWSWQKRLRAGQTAAFTVRTPLDGKLAVELVAGRGSVGLDSRKARRFERVVCGRRSWVFRVEAASAGIFRLSVTAP
jgi:hypothetical protein